MINTTFGRLLVIAKSSRVGKNIYWDCLCSCGTPKTVSASHLTLGHTRSCGCLQRETASKVHGEHWMTGGSTHRVWGGMLYRCSNPNSKIYKFYGGRGITVCERWKSFPNFLADMGPKPLGMSLDRIDAEKGYEPDNCRWADKLTQANNTRSNLFVEYKGDRLTVAQMARLHGVDPLRIYQRLKMGWDIDKAIEEPKHWRG